MWDFVILIGWMLGVARVTRLLTIDRITEAPRIALARRFGENSAISYLANCMWCVSIWVAAASTPVAVYMANRTWPQAVLFGFVASYVTGMLSGLDSGGDEIEFEVEE